MGLGHGPLRRRAGLPDARRARRGASKYGELAIEYLERAKQKPTAAASYLLGRLYFRIGAVYALRDKNHRAAVSWFDKALPLLEKPLPPGSLRRPRPARRNVREHGRFLLGRRPARQGRRADPTRRGADGVGRQAEGCSTRPSLTVAYSNLATMHRTLGEPENAVRFENMANACVGQETTR